MIKHCVDFYLKCRVGSWTWTSRFGSEHVIEPKTLQTFYEIIHQDLVASAPISIEIYGQEAYDEALSYALSTGQSHHLGITTALQLA